MTEAEERFQTNLRPEKTSWKTSSNLRIDNAIKTKLIILGARNGLSSNNSVVATLVAMYEDELGYEIK